MSLKRNLNLSVDTAFLINGTDVLQRACCLNNGKGDAAKAAIALLQEILVNLLQHDRPKYLAVCFDDVGGSFRTELYPEYQKNVLLDAPLLGPVTGEMKQYLADNNISIVSVPKREAVDCIASIASIVSDDVPVAILSADRRMLQCVTDQVCVWDPFRGYEQAVTLNKFTADIGIAPTQWADFYALNGDSVNNIPDYISLGSANIKKLLGEYGAINEVFLPEHLKQLSDSLKEKLIAHKVDLFEAQKIATLATDSFDCFKLEDLVLLQQNVVQHRCQFPFVPRYAGGAHYGEEAIVEVLYDELPVVSSVDELPSSCEKIIALLLGEQIGTDNWILAVEGHEYEYGGEISELVTYVGSARKLVVLDLKELYLACAEWQRIPMQKFFDLRIAAFLLDSSTENFSWGWFVQKAQLNGMATKYVGQTAIGLANFFTNQLVERGLLDWMHTIEQPMRKILLDMEQVGIGVDEPQLSLLENEFSQQAEDKRKIIYERAGKEFNIRSSKQLKTLLYDDLKLRFKGQKKKPNSVKIDDLECLDDPSGFVDEIIDSKQFENLLSKIASLRKYICRGVVHTTFNHTGIRTGRITSSKPDLQSLSKRTKYTISQCLTAREGKIFLSADYSQAELRVLAHYSSDPFLLEVLQKSGGDIHVQTAAQMYGRPPHLITAEERNSAKEINFGIMNGMGAYGLAKNLGVSLKEASKFLATYMDIFPMVKMLVNKIVYDCQRNGGVYTLAGRFRALPNINSSYAKLRCEAERRAVSTTMQGTVADILRCAMCNVVNDRELSAIGAGLVLEVHDELVLEVPEEHISVAAERLVDCMTQIELCSKVGFQVPLDVNISAGRSLGALKKFA